MGGANPARAGPKWEEPTLLELAPSGRSHTDWRKLQRFRAEANTRERERERDTQRDRDRDRDRETWGCGRWTVSVNVQGYDSLGPG